MKATGKKPRHILSASFAALSVFIALSGDPLLAATMVCIATAVYLLEGYA